MTGNEKVKWLKIVVILFLVLVPVTAAIAVLYLFNRKSGKDFAVSLKFGKN